MLKNWRSWVLLLLFVGPYAIFIALGFLWLWERGKIWAVVASLFSIGTGALMSVLLSRWTKSSRSFLPPIDWDAPGTFSEFDRKAWELVEAEAERGDALDMAALTQFQTYIDTGQKLATRLAAHYNPLSADPIERVAVVELLTALELAAEDLVRLCRQVPGGDLVTPADWKRALVAAGYIQKASDLYSYLLPIFNPATGIPRLASQHLMVKPAWKNMQQNLLRWFFRAFVNRLGTHLIELYSGRLAIGADQYRKLTRKVGRGLEEVATDFDLTIAVGGAKESGKSTLIKTIEAARAGLPDFSPGDETGPARFKTARLVEIPGYTPIEPGRENARNRSTRRHAVDEAAKADLLILAVALKAPSREADAAFLHDWVRWYADHPGLERPPALAVATNASGGPDDAPAIVAIRTALAPTVVEIVPDSAGVEALREVLADACRRAERNALIHHLKNASARSRAGRLIRQVGQQGRSLWSNFRDRKKVKDGRPA